MTTMCLNPRRTEHRKEKGANRMTLDYNQRTVDALSKALGMTSEQVGRILTDYEAMRPDIPLGLSDTGWYISQDHKWFFHHCADGSCQIVAASPCPNTPPSLRRRGLNVPHVHRLWCENARPDNLTGSERKRELSSATPLRHLQRTSGGRRPDMRGLRPTGLQ